MVAQNRLIAQLTPRTRKISATAGVRGILTNPSSTLSKKKSNRNPNPNFATQSQKGLPLL